MAKKPPVNPVHMHMRNALTIVAPSLVLTLLSALFLGAGYGTLQYGEPTVALVLSLLSVLCAASGLGTVLPNCARLLEYSKLGTIFASKKIYKGANLKADKYINAMSITTTHMRTLALAFSALKNGASFEEELEFIVDIARQRPRLVQLRPFTKAWWKAQFSPLELE